MLWRMLAMVALLALVGCGKSPDELLSAARALHEKGERNGAILQVKSLLQEHPDHVPSRLYLGLLYNETADYAGAEKELRRALDGNADPSQVLPALAKALLMQGEAKKVLAEIDAAKVSDPAAVARILASRGSAYMMLRQNEDARSEFEKALAAKPGSSEALVGRARLLATERKIDEALAEVGTAISNSPQDADALMLKGDLLRAAGKSAEAEASYKALVEVHPSHVAGLLALVSMAVGADRLDDATTHLAAARKAAPGNAMVSYFQALIHFRKNDFKAARDAIGAVLKVAPNHLPSVLLGGAIEFALGSQELAQTRLKFVLERAPGNLYARRVLAASYTRAGQTQKALEVLEPVLKAGVKDPAIFALAGEVYMQLNDYERARGYFEQASALAPKSARLRTGVGLSRLAAGDVEAATADLETASQLDTTRNQADVLLVTTHLQRRQFDQALKAAQSLISKQPDSPVGYNLSAAAHIGRRDDAAARAALLKALEVQPTYVPAASNLAQLDIKQGDKPAARKRLEGIVARDSKNIQAYIALAQFGPQLSASDEEIVGWLEAARRADPAALQPLVLLTQRLMQAGQVKRALELLDKALAAAPDRRELLELVGQAQLAAGEKNRALRTLGNLVASYPSATAHFLLSTAQIANEDHAGAIKSLRAAIDFHGSYAEAQVLLAELEARQGRLDDALKITKRLQEQNPKSSVGWIAEGDALMRGKRFGQAAKAYDRAMELQPSSGVLVRWHRAVSADSRESEGFQRIRTWLSRYPDDQSLRAYLAERLLVLSRYREAAVEYELMVRANANDVVALNNLAWAYLQLKDGRALETAERAHKLKSDNPSVLDTYGMALVAKGEYARGLDVLQSAAKLGANIPQVRFHYARALATHGDAKKARAELERLLVEFPEFPDAKAALALLERLRRG